MDITLENKELERLKHGATEDLYTLLVAEMENDLDDIDLPRLIFLTGAVHALRLVNGLEVPEIEMAFAKIRLLTGKRLEGVICQ